MNHTVTGLRSTTTLAGLQLPFLQSRRVLFYVHLLAWFIAAVNTLRFYNSACPWTVSMQWRIATRRQWGICSLPFECWKICLSGGMRNTINWSAVYRRQKAKYFSCSVMEKLKTESCTSLNSSDRKCRQRQNCYGNAAAPLSIEPLYVNCTQ